MITRNRNNKDSPSNCENLQVEQLCERQIRCSRTTLRNTDEQSIHADMQRLQSPIFNIHIHVPPYKGDSLKMYLPRIQPVIHLHFDELARKLEINRGEQNEEATYRVFQNLLRMTSPKFGDVKFHYQNESQERVFREAKDSGKARSSSRNHCNDAAKNVGTNTEGVEGSVTGNSKITECYGSLNCGSSSNKSPENRVNESSNNPEEQLRWKLHKDYRLKEAVVVLRDICKSKYYKNVVAARSVDNEYETSDSSRTVENKTGQKNGPVNNEDCPQHFIKRENESRSPESVSPDGREKRVEIIYGNSTYASNNTSCRLRATDITSNLIALGSPDKTLTGLAEGCNFSEILSRFRLKHSDEYPDGYVKCFEHKTKAEASHVLRGNDNWESNERVREEPGVEKMASNDRKCSLGGDASDDVENESHFQDYLENDANVDDTSFQSLSSDFKSKGVTLRDTAFKIRLNRYHSDSVVDDGDRAPENQSASEEATSCSQIEINPLSKAVLLDNVHKFPENYVNCPGPSVFDLEKMRRKQLEKSDNDRTERKKKALESDSSTSPSPPKKMKDSNEESEYSHRNWQNSSDLVEYIPLQACGPTKFAVAPLDKVSPYKTHNARNFKEEMLFGKRVNRFSSPDHLRMYKLKQKAAKSQAGIQESFE